jgi:hypothetical protein
MLFYKINSEPTLPLVRDQTWVNGIGKMSFIHSNVSHTKVTAFYWKRSGKKKNQFDRLRILFCYPLPVVGTLCSMPALHTNNGIEWASDHS